MKMKDGELFHGRYRIISKLGEGSVGTVYRATQVDSGREVALKLLHESSDSAELDRERFLREFKILAHLSHEHIVTFYSAAISPEGFPYAVFEYMRGADLHHTILDQSKLDFQRTLKIAVQICLAMEHAHEQSIIHRDLKPENIMLVELPEHDWVKVLDFGFARDEARMSDTRQKLTATGMVVGTVCYLSPEQCKGGKASIQSDIYALGCIIFECLTGHLLFEADTPLGVVHKQLYEDPSQALKQIQPIVPAGLIAILKKSLDKEPANRYRSMRELRIDLLALPAELGQAQPTASAKPKIIALAAAVILCSLAAWGVNQLAKINHTAASSKKAPRLSKHLGSQSAKMLIEEAHHLILQHEYDAAELRLQIALEKSNHDKNAVTLFKSQEALAQIALEKNDANSYHKRVEEVMTTARKYFGKRSNQFFIALQLTADSYAVDDPKKANAVFEELLAKASEEERHANSSFCEYFRNYIYFLQSHHDLKVAEQVFDKYNHYFTSEFVDDDVHCKFLVMKAENKYSLGKISEADKITNDGIVILEKDSDLLLQQQTALVVNWSDMLFRAGQKEKAFKLIEKAEHKLEQSGGGLWLSELYIAEAKMYFSSEKYEKTIDVLDSALSSLHKANEKKPSALMTEILYFKSECCLRLKHLQQAKAALDEADGACPEDLSAIRAKCNALRQEITEAATTKGK